MNAQFDNSPLQSLRLYEPFLFLKDGLEMILSREYRFFLVVPLLINLVVMGVGGYLAFVGLHSFLESYLNLLPEFLSFLSYVVYFLLIASLGFAFCYFFSTVATIIASPFYGILAEKVELKLAHTRGNDDGVMDIVKDVPRILARELRKQAFFLPRALLCLIVTFVPLLNVISPVLWFILTAYMATLQYSDYAFDNHKLPFARMRKTLSSQKPVTLLLGAVVALALTVPLLNLLVAPVAVCAGTRYYLRLRDLDPTLRRDWEGYSAKEDAAGTAVTAAHKDN